MANSEYLLQDSQKLVTLFHTSTRLESQPRENGLINIPNSRKQVLTAATKHTKHTEDTPNKNFRVTGMKRN